MIDLIRGDVENLEGKVTIYTRLKNDETDSSCDCSDQNCAGKERNGFPAFYLTTDILDIADKLGFDAEPLKKIVEESTRKQEDALKKRKIKIIKLFFLPIFYRNENDILNNSGDIIRVAGQYNDHNCGRILQNAESLYGGILASQLENKWNLSSLDPERNESQSSPGVYEGGEIGNHLLKEYLIPMMDEINHRGGREIDSLREDLISFGGKHPTLMPDILTLSHIVEKNGNDRKLIQFYINKIDAIHQERYESAAKYRDNIIKLEKGE